jgi:ABC-type transporter Mla MlaB component
MKPGSSVPYLHTTVLPPHQEAAVRFANGQSGDARDLLEQLVQAPDADAQIWALLFDLYRCEGDWPRFDALAARFQSRFQRPAPPWQRAGADDMLPPAMRAGGDAWVQVAGALDARAVARLHQARDKALHHASLHLDVSRVDGVDADGATALSSLVRFLAANGNALLLSGSRELIELLREAVSGDGTLSAYWTLLFDLYQLAGRRVEFERAAVEYALSSGAPAPAWEAVVMPLAPGRELREQRDEPRYQAGPEVIALSEGSERELLALSEFAGGRRYVNIDLEELERITPAAAAGLVHLVNELVDQHVVRLLRPTALVGTLLETLELDPRVQLVRAQSI